MADKLKVRFTTDLKLASRQLRAQEARHALSDYEVANQAVAQKTARLRALRLAKEAADAAAEQSKDADRRPRPRPASRKTTRISRP